MAQPKHVLAIRFSALGDVAMTVPVIKELLQEYSDLEVTFVSKPLHAALFKDIDRLHFYSVDTDKYKGIFGLRKLAGEINSNVDFDAIVDLHSVLRSKLLRLFLQKNSVPVGVIGKGRNAKHKVTRKKTKN